MKKIKPESFWRVNLLFLAAIIGFLSIFARLIFLQIFKFSDYKAAADEQHRMFKEILPERGNIYVSEKSGENYFPAAVNKKSFLFYAVPREIEDKNDFISQISPIIRDEMKRDDNDLKTAMKRVLAETENIEIKESVEKKFETDVNANQGDFEQLDDVDEYLLKSNELLESKLQNMDDPYEVILEKVSEESAEKIKNIGLKGVYFSESHIRYYPEQEFAADVLGFVGFKGEKRIGRYGIEEFFDTELEGESGSILGEKDTRGRWVFIGDKEVDPAKNGYDIYLTIDRNIQFKAEEILKEAARDYKIDAGSIVVARPQTGEILAMADWPTFNPNHYGKFSDFDVFQNGAIQRVYEPGSVFKVFTMSAAINEGKISPNTKYEDKGFSVVRDRVIRNVNGRSYGFQTMTEVLEKSLNTGAIFAQQSISAETFLEYVKRYNFGEITGVELSGEISGSTRVLKDLPANPVNYATVSFGQGISATALEIVSAVSAIANQGALMRPYIVSKISGGGSEFAKNPEEARQVISLETAVKISAMMVSVVRNGSGSPAAVSGYNIAGKTGTAQIPENGVYTDKSIHSFIGFGPLENPAFAMLVKFDNPKDIRFSSATAAPAFGKLAKFILEYYGIAPE